MSNINQARAAPPDATLIVSEYGRVLVFSLIKKYNPRVKFTLETMAIDDNVFLDFLNKY